MDANAFTRAAGYRTEKSASSHGSKLRKDTRCGSGYGTCRAYLVPGGYFYSGGYVP
jgi:hypothetical protein